MLFRSVIYGHAGNGHPHQNFIARDANELTTIEEVVEQTLRHVLSLGGTVAAEHGIGKIKRNDDRFRVQYHPSDCSFAKWRSDVSYSAVLRGRNVSHPAHAGHCQ